jgi:2-succinyl-5-enolpyruvyl-6-hydroxy-3-cyclohexene-1-carboxylate synthase
VTGDPAPASAGDVSLACAWALVDELAAGGVRHACVSPGSRSTPIALALARHPAVDVHVHLDERSSAFVALGIAKATHRPVAIGTTSGTAAAELLPAIVEASQSRTPLVALTADRPPRMRGTGANQTIDQTHLFGRYARAFEEPPVPRDTRDAGAWRAAGTRAFDASVGEVPGPAHVNCPFDEPLTPTGALELPAPSSERRPDEPPLAETPGDAERDRLAELVSGRRGVVVVGGWPGEDLSRVGRFWTEVMGWPVIAEPHSGARVPGWSLAAGQSLLASGRRLDRRRPEVVVQLGATPTSRATQALVASVPDLVVADRLHLDPDPARRATLRMSVDPHALPELLGDADAAPATWLLSWVEADLVGRAALDRFLDSVEEPVEPRLARDLAAWVPDGGTLFVGNSSPIRDLDLAMAPRHGLRVLANRGASGIDGLVSTAVGVSTATDGPTVALLGDLSVVHDVGALAWRRNHALDLVLVVANNGGGELFSALPQRVLPDHRDLFLTPHGLDLGALVDALGIGYERVEHASELSGTLERAVAARGLRVVEVTIDVDRQRAARREIPELIDAALLRSAGGRADVR